MLKRVIIITGSVIGAIFLGTLAFSIFGTSKPDDLGITNGRFAPCPDSPNCVSTQSAGGYPQMQPIPYNGDTAAARAAILEIVESMPRSRVITADDAYLHIEFRSRIFRFVDDVEFFFDEPNQEIHFRAAARMGSSDMNVNPQRMESIRDEFEARRGS